MERERSCTRLLRKLKSTRISLEKQSNLWRNEAEVREEIEDGRKFQRVIVEARKTVVAEQSSIREREAFGRSANPCQTPQNTSL